MQMLRRGFFIIAAGAAFIATSLSAVAADITAEQSALIFDLISPLASGMKIPGKPDTKILDNAVSVLKKEELSGLGGRPNFQENGILENYGKALFLGARAPEFATDIGHIRDIVSSGDRTALEQALTSLWVKAGRARGGGTWAAILSISSSGVSSSSSGRDLGLR